MQIDELEPKIKQAASLMGMLSQPARLRLMCLLLEGEKSVLELAAALKLSQPGMSHHLKKLRDADLVQTRREGQSIYYSLKGSEVKAVLETLHGLYCR